MCCKSAANGAFCGAPAERCVTVLWCIVSCCGVSVAGDVLKLGDGRLADGSVKPFYLKEGQTVSSSSSSVAEQQQQQRGHVTAGSLHVNVMAGSKVAMALQTRICSTSTHFTNACSCSAKLSMGLFKGLR
jgi:hypothetical protein